MDTTDSHNSIPTATKSIKRNKLPTHSVSIEIYSGIARFPCASTAFLFSLNFVASLQVNTDYRLAGSMLTGTTTRIVTSRHWHNREANRLVIGYSPLANQYRRTVQLICVHVTCGQHYGLCSFTMQCLYNWLSSHSSVQFYRPGLSGVLPIHCPNGEWGTAKGHAIFTDLFVQSLCSVYRLVATHAQTIIIQPSCSACGALPRGLATDSSCRASKADCLLANGNLRYARGIRGAIQSVGSVHSPSSHQPSAISLDSHPHYTNVTDGQTDGQTGAGHFGHKTFRQQDTSAPTLSRITGGAVSCRNYPGSKVSRLFVDLMPKCLVPRLWCRSVLRRCWSV